MVKDKKQTLYDQYKYAVLVGLGSFVVLLILVFAIGKPLWAELQKSSATLKEKRAVLTKLEDKLANLKSLKDQEAELKVKNDKVLAALPTDKNVSRLFVQFENVASASGLTISGVSEAGAAGSTNTSAPTVATNTTGAVREVTYNVTGNSNSYGDLKNALSNLEKALRILSVSKINVTSSGSNMTVNLSVSTYLRGE